MTTEPSMSDSSTKHRGPPRAIDTLSSARKPSFQTPGRSQAQPAPPRAELSLIDSDDESSFESSFLDSSSLQEITSVSHLGNSSSIFDHDDRTPNHPRLSPPPTPTPPPNRSFQAARADPVKAMVREREPMPSRDPQRQSLFRPRESDNATPARESQPVAPPTRPGPVQAKPPLQSALQSAASTAPKFGESSPMRNPLKKPAPKPAPKDPYAHLFNVPKPGQPRPEHHRTAQPPAYVDPPAYSVSENPMGNSAAYQPSRRAPPHSATENPMGNSAAYQPFRRAPPQLGPRPTSDFEEIPAAQFQPRQPYQGVPVNRPTNQPARSIPPTPRAVYSSMGQGNGFQPVNSGYNPVNPHGSRQTVILPDYRSKPRDEDDEGDFDPDAAIRAEGRQFGAPDPMAYVDSSKAEENIKALLEGAFEGDDEKIPRTRGRKKKQQQKKDDEASQSLADKLAALDVKDAKDEPQDDEDEDDEDDGTVDGMNVKLLPHQVDGVAWMIEKETGAHMKKIPPKGGILADDMGLGKTIQSIALILSNTRPAKDAEMENKKNKIMSTVGKGTLIVAPLALIKQWEAEINSKVTKSHSLKVLVHHGPSRTKSPDKLKSYDVVVTTYQVLSSEYAQCGDGPEGLQKGCFAVNWYRVILDEAHTIKNRSAKMTKACYEVRAHYRWCLTGTPMQNNLEELQSLIKFLRIKPYCDLPSWKESISGPMKNGRGNLAMRRLQIFLKAFMKRRTKEVLKKEGALNFGGKAAKNGDEKPAFQIVDRNIENVIGSFTAQEREFYDRLSNRAETRLAEMMGGEKTDYIGALVLLLRLRQACNHPNLTKSNVKDDKDALTTGSRAQPGTQTPRKGRDADADADDLADLLGGMSVAAKRCDICQTSLHRDNTTNGSIRCHDCEEDLSLSTKKSRKHKKERKICTHKKDRKPKVEVYSGDEDEDDVKAPISKTSRQRRVIMDSDDEEESGEWLVEEDEQKPLNLGKAGGTDDENADGVADSLGSIDSDSFATDEGTPSKKREGDSFIVHDTDSEDEAPIFRKRQPQKKVINLVSDDDSEASCSQCSDSETETDNSDIEYRASDLTPSTKIRQLLSILEKETPDHKVIVFSQFTSMLDLIEPFLRREKYNFTRYDGSMRNDVREASLNKLRTDKRTRVLLCSLKCGSLGLNLTVASRVVIMEPFWNPFVEEQAIDRVHRLNQTVDVTVYRLSIHNTVEERILELQEAKRKLATAALEGGKAMGKLDMKDMLALFKHNAELDERLGEEDKDLFAPRRVLDRDEGEGGESTKTSVRRKEGSLGLGVRGGRIVARGEDSVYGRR